ncbi:transposase [uncultured Granulicatella sp.]|uniref:IS66 family transposase n=1 Tax=uncultured Granulicatella sp. TaxID=316089 RepID=UPI0028D42E2C|nr:transposase [uncultured Granulicatella sp.]
MSIPLNKLGKVFIVCGKTDMRQGIDSLAFWIKEHFQLEQEWESLSAEERHQKRQEEMKPIMDEFFDWCRENNVLTASKLGKAIEYSLKYETTFRIILEDGNLVLSNNLSERAIKSLVMGRKNWLFSQSFKEHNLEPSL